MKKLVSRALIAFLCSAPVRADLIRLHLEYLDVPHETMTEVMNSEDADSGPALHARLRVLVKEKSARVFETSIMTIKSGQTGALESIREMIYPTEYEPSGLGSGVSTGGTVPGTDGVFPLPLRPSSGTAFETRNTGVTLVAEARHDDGDKIIDLRLAPEIVNPLRLEEWMEHKDEWGDASQRMPIFESLRVSTGILLENGKWGFVGMLTPTDPTGGLVTERKLMLFVKADIIPIEVPGKEKAKAKEER
jgi:general secretion pathway protein D